MKLPTLRSWQAAQGAGVVPVSKRREVMNLIESIQTEQNRVRELLKQYEKIGPSGMFGSMILKQAIEHGDRSIASGDAVDMLRAHAELKGCTG